jgi:hypothetical protein
MDAAQQDDTDAKVSLAARGSVVGPRRRSVRGRWVLDFAGRRWRGRRRRRRRLSGGNILHDGVDLHAYNTHRGRRYDCDLGKQFGRRSYGLLG